MSKSFRRRLSQAVNLGLLRWQMSHEVEHLVGHQLIVSSNLQILLPELFHPCITLLRADVRGRPSMQLVKTPLANKLDGRNSRHVGSAFEYIRVDESTTY